MYKISNFINNIKRIDIEFYNQCNRKCKHCPQSLQIRPTDLLQLNSVAYLSLLKDLNKIEFKEKLAIGRYHEPLLYKDITYQNISLARDYLPHTYIYLNTNGDFVDKKSLKELSSVGLNEIKIMRYCNNVYEDDQAKNLCNSLADKLELETEYITYKKNVIFYIALKSLYDTKISIRCENYQSERGCDRGGLLDFHLSERRQACFTPIQTIDIDYNGCVLPCCNIISDAVPHKEYIFGNINNHSIIDIYDSILTSEFVKKISIPPYDFPEICRHCIYT